MTTHNEPSIARRPFLRGAGVTLATLGGMTGSVVARRGGKVPLADRSADILVYWSQVGPEAGDGDADNPNKPGEFGYPNTPFFGGNDPSGGGLFDFSRIEMTPNGGTLHNKWLLFGGLLVASDPEKYVLVHRGGGLYESRGQEMDFEARPKSQIIGILQSEGWSKAQAQWFANLPPINELAGGSWLAVGTERAQLALDGDKKPDPAQPEWGATRIDIYSAETGEYALSLLYLIGADDGGTDAPDGIPDPAYGVAGKLIAGGRLGPSSP